MQRLQGLLICCLLYTSRCVYEKGTQINAGTTVTTLEDIPQGHKIALADIKEGEKVIKYGFPIGVAKQDIKAGSWVHVHNVKTGLGDVLDYEYNPSGSELEPTEHAHFMGYRREDGRVGVRNEIWIIPTVGCVNSCLLYTSRCV